MHITKEIAPLYLFTASLHYATGANVTKCDLPTGMSHILVSDST
jgi:hypothetical protein